MRGDKEEGESRKKRTRELWMARRRGEPQQTASSVGTTAGRHSQKGRKRASTQDEGTGETCQLGSASAAAGICSVAAAARTELEVRIGALLRLTTDLAFYVGLQLHFGRAG